MPAETAISRSVLSDAVKDRLLEAILDGRYPPGSRIVETRVARELGTSQAPVREALRDLEALGVVEIAPFRGARVRRPSRDELLEAYVVRAELEAMAVRLALPTFTAEDLDALAGFVDEMLRAADAGETVAEASADAAFHGYLVGRAANRTLLRVWSQLEPYSRTYINMALPRGDRRRMAALHAPVLDALRSGDSALAEAAIHQHFSTAQASLAERWPDPADPTPGPGKDPMNATLQLTEEFSAGAARLRVDVYGGDPREHVLDDLTFLNYRLADVRISPEVTLADSDIVWNQDGEKAVTYDGRTVTFTGSWPAGPIQKVIVAVLALRMEAVGLHPSHSAAVHYRGKTLLFLGGESNHGKSMGLIEAGVRGALQVASETTVIDEDGRASMGSVDTFLVKRTEGTERSDKAAPNKGVEKFWGEMPSWGMYEGTPNIDLVIVPAIDGNFDPATNELIPFERQFQFLHSLQNYFLTNELLAPGHVMPMVDNDVLRAKRADFVARFCERPFFFIRAATPQILLDEVDRIL